MFLFRPVELWTKLGLRGHIRCESKPVIFELQLMDVIREPLGTHGYMKCAFDGVVNQQDTVRVFRHGFALMFMTSSLLLCGV